MLTRAAIDQLAAYATTVGATLPPEGIHVNDQIVQLLAAIVAATGGAAPTEGSFNDRVAAMLDALATSGGEASVDDYQYADLVDSGDPNGIDNGTAADQESGYVQFNLDTPGTARLPGATDIGGVYVEWALPNTWVPSDLASAIAYVLQETPPVDTYVAIAVTKGGVGTIGNGGVLVGIEYNAGGWRCFTMLNAGAGAGWITKTNATAVDALTRGVQMMIGQGNAAANTRIHAVALEPGGRPSSTSATTPAPQSGNGATTTTGTPWDRIALVCGWSGTGGASTAQITASVRTSVRKLKDAPRAEQLLTAYIPVPTQGGRVALLGDSNGNGTQIDLSKGAGVIAVTNPGWTVRDAGANLTLWPATTTPGTGMLPYLLDDLDTAGVTPGWIARRATNGGDALWAGTIHNNVAGLLADAVALGGGDPHLLIFVIGANDATAASGATTAPAFADNLRRACESLRAAWPDTLLVFVVEESQAGAGGNYPYLRDTAPTIASSLATLATEFGGVVVTPTGLPHADDIHFSSDGAGSGQDQLAALVSAAYLAAVPA